MNPVPEPTILGVDMAAPGSDMTVEVTKDADGNVINIERIDAPREPAPPVGANTVKAGDESSPFTKEQLDAIRKHMAERTAPPTIELVGVNGKPVTSMVIDDPMQPEGINGQATISSRSSRTVLPPNIDIHKKLMVNTNTCRGKIAKRAARMQLKGARKEQMRLLKEERRG